MRDTDIGIRGDLLPHVFELFMQADQSLARSLGGLGIGHGQCCPWEGTNSLVLYSEKIFHQKVFALLHAKLPIEALGDCKSEYIAGFFPSGRT